MRVKSTFDFWHFLTRVKRRLDPNGPMGPRWRDALIDDDGPIRFCQTGGAKPKTRDLGFPSRVLAHLFRFCGR
jgi:hypothetical protein